MYYCPHYLNVENFKDYRSHEVEFQGWVFSSHLLVTTRCLFHLCCLRTIWTRLRFKLRLCAKITSRDIARKSLLKWDRPSRFLILFYHLDTPKMFAGNTGVPRTRLGRNNRKKDKANAAQTPETPSKFPGNASAPSTSPSPIPPNFDWLADTGVTSHMTPHRHWVRNYLPLRIPIRLADNSIVYSSGVGTVLTFLENVENYLDGKGHPDGVPIPQDLLGDFVQIFYGSARASQYRLPHIEKLMATMTAQFAHNRFSHSTSRQMLEGFSHLVQQIYPTNHNKDLFNLRCPELLYLRPEFEQDEPRHPDDTGDQLPNEYFGCLPRKEAFIFQQLYPKFSDTIYYTAVATRKLLDLSLIFQSACAGFKLLSKRWRFCHTLTLWNG